MKRLLVILLSLFSFALLVSPAQAADFRVPSSDKGNVTVAQDEKVSNLYTVGNILNIDANVNKSLYMAGNVITINGDVENDLKVAGNTILLRGSVGGSAHLAGSSIVIDGPVADDLFVAAGNVTIADTAKIGGDLFVGGGVVNLQAPVDGKVTIGGGQVTIDSTVSGDVKAQADEVILGDKADLKGNLTYKSPQELNMSENATVAGSVDYEHIDGNVIPQDRTNFSKEMKGALAVFATTAVLLKFSLALISSFVVFFLFGKLMRDMQKEVMTKFWSKAGLGFLLLVALPIASILLLISIVGIWLAALNIMVFALLFMLAKAMANIFFGLWLMKTLRKKKSVELTWQPVLLGALVLPAIGMIPVVGCLIGFVFTLVVLASLYQLLYAKVLKK